MNKITLSLEFKVLIESCASAFLPERAKKLDFFLSNQAIDWDEVLKIATVHSVRPLLLKGLSFTEKRVLSPTFYDRLKKDCHSIAIKSLLNKQELLRVLNIFREHNITVIPYKGIVMAQEIYNSPILRENSDIDLFTYRKDIFRIKNILTETEYKPELNLTKNQLKSFLSTNCEYNFSYQDKNNIKYRLEPHFQTNQYFDSIDLDLNRLEGFFKSGIIEKTDITIFSPSATLLILTTHHGVKEGWGRLKYIIDIHALCVRHNNEIDWHWLVEQSKKLDIETMLLIGVGLSNYLLNTPIPASMKSLIETVRINNHITNRLELLNERNATLNYLDHYYYFLKTRKSLVSKFKMLFNLIFMPSLADVQFFNLPHRLFFLYFLARPLRLSYIYIKIFIKKS